MTTTLAIDIKCRKCKECHRNGDQEEKLHEYVKKSTDFSYLVDIMYSGGGCEAAVTSRNRLGLVKLRDCHDLLCRKTFTLKIKGSVCKSCVKSTMLYGSVTWCLCQNKVGILQRTERAMVSSMCGVKVMDKKSTKDLMLMLH